MARSKPVISERVEILRIQESQKTRRYLILTVGFIVSLGIIAWAAVQIAEKPPWLIFALAILAALAGPSSLLLVFVRYVWRWTKRHISRETKLESQADPNRSSSALNSDGTDPPESLP
jgi:hypothetical protein